MKVFVRFLFASTLVAMLAGCASNTLYVPKIPPQAQASLLDYFEQPNSKVFVIAVDPCGDYAIGYDSGKSSIKEAAQSAFEKCNAERAAKSVISKAYIYATDDKVVYEKVILETRVD